MYPIWTGPLTRADTSKTQEMPADAEIRLQSM